MSAQTLSDWMDRQYGVCAQAILAAVSATHLVKRRPHLGQTIRPARGSILASPELASYDPDPDYFFHWLRDSAIVADALRTLYEAKTLGHVALDHLSDFVNFSLALGHLDGRMLARAAFHEGVDPAFRAHIRSGEEMAQVFGDRVLGDVRFNADGSFDILKWSRPQNDGPALRALTVLRMSQLDALSEATRQTTTKLLHCDLDYTLAHWREPGFDLWEEICAHHYYTRLVQYAALAAGADWSARRGDDTRAHSYRSGAREIYASLDDFYDPDEGFYQAFLPDPGNPKRIPPARRLDIAPILGVIHARYSKGRHSVLDPRALATLARLETFFAGDYEINRTRPQNCAPAMGRYPADVYFSGGAYYFSTLGAAEFYYRFAQALRGGAQVPVSQDNRALLAAMLEEEPAHLGVSILDARLRDKLFQIMFERGDMFMEMVRAYTPASGALSEQFSQTDGSQTSAKNLAWSYAAFVTAYEARRAGLRESMR